MGWSAFGLDWVLGTRGLNELARLLAADMMSMMTCGLRSRLSRRSIMTCWLTEYRYYDWLVMID